MNKDQLARIAALNLNPNDLAMLSALAQKADEHGKATASNAALADELGVTPRAIQKVRARLEDTGHITVDRYVQTGRNTAGQHPNTYTLNI